MRKPQPEHPLVNSFAPHSRRAGDHRVPAQIADRAIRIQHAGSRRWHLDWRSAACSSRFSASARNWTFQRSPARKFAEQPGIEIERARPAQASISRPSRTSRSSPARTPADRSTTGSGPSRPGSQRSTSPGWRAGCCSGSIQGRARRAHRERRPEYAAIRPFNCQPPSSFRRRRRWSPTASLCQTAVRRRTTW